MKFVVISSVMALGVVACLTGCSGSSATPQASLKALLNDLRAGDAAHACETYIDQSIIDALQKSGTSCEAAIKNVEIPAGDIVIDTSKISVSGDSAQVSRGGVTIGGKSLDAFNGNMKKVDGKWKFSQ
jgi:hypothetical protein